MTPVLMLLLFIKVGSAVSPPFGSQRRITNNANIRVTNTGNVRVTNPS